MPRDGAGSRRLPWFKAVALYHSSVCTGGKVRPSGVFPVDAGWPPLSSSHSSDTVRCLPGSIATTGIGRMLASHANHRSAASA
jgi:hypothetical protein